MLRKKLKIPRNYGSEKMIMKEIGRHDYIIVVEDHRKTGGLGSSINLHDDYKIAFPDAFIDDVGDVDYLYNKYGLTAEKIAKRIRKILTLNK